jgi:hypothetical protein
MRTLKYLNRHILKAKETHSAAFYADHRASVLQPGFLACLDV